MPAFAGMTVAGHRRHVAPSEKPPEGGFFIAASGLLIA
jgi:hypothetical protein